MGYPDYSGLFVDGAVVESVYGEVTLRVFGAGELRVRSGRLVACDAFVPEVESFSRVVEPGSYPVVLSVAQFEDDDERVAAAMLKLGEGRPVSWEMALIEGQELEALAEGEVFGYPVDVDSVAGCFVDAEAAGALSRAEVEEALAEELDKSYVDTWAWANLVIEGAEPLNVVAFSTGMGEGLYASYFGFDEGGRVVCLVTDFALLEQEGLR